MKKLMLLPVVCLVMFAWCQGQSMVAFGGPGYHVEHPEDWKVEEVTAERLVKIFSEPKAALFQVAIGEKKDRTAMGCLVDWIEAMGYQPDDLVSMEGLEEGFLTKIEAHDGAQGVFKHQEQGAELYMSFRVYVRNNYVCFLTLTCMQDDTATTGVLNQIADGFQFLD